MSEFDDWAGREAREEAVAEHWPIRGLLALLDAGPDSADDAAVPPLGHWCYFPPQVPQSRLGPDGHPRRGDFLPPLPQPRRMWAGSDIVFHAPIPLGSPIARTARIASIAEKTGRSGTLVFVTVANRIEADGRLALEETQTLVYRDDPAPGEAPPAPRAAPADAAWSSRVEPDPALLFRYSAVTFNAHRIHYDAPYAGEVEGYPGLVVHGQLTATLMLRAALAARPGLAPARFSFRAVKPLIAGSPFHVEGAPDEAGGAGAFRLWAKNGDGHLAMTADLAGRA